MKMEKRTFTYVKADGSRSTRDVFVVAEDSNFVQGLDLQYVSKADAEKIVKLTGDIQKVTGRNAKAPAGFNADWNKAWRMFRKDRIDKN